MKLKSLYTSIAGVNIMRPLPIFGETVDSPKRAKKRKRANKRR
jgi:hypothetical protein